MELMKYNHLYYDLKKYKNNLLITFSSMVKNKGKGGKYYKRSKNISNDDKRQLIFKEPGQEYAIVKKIIRP